MNRLQRYFMRLREAGALHTSRILASRLAGYALWPRNAWSKSRGHHLGPAGEGQAVGSAQAHDGSFRIFWTDQGLAGLAHGLTAGEPALGAALVQRADALLADGAPLLGWGRADLGVPVRWSTDGSSGTTWPPDFHKRIDTAREGEPCDVKFPWELSRLQFLPVLAGAWLASQDARYASAVWNLVNDWSASNPEGFGVNWTCSMEVAIRAINLAAALNLVEAALTAPRRRFARRLLRAHERHLRWNLEVSDVNGNHLFFDLLGMALLSLMLDGPAAGRFRQDLERLAAETEAQFHADGVHIEHATGYQRLMLEGLVLFQLATQSRGIPPDPRLEGVTRRALDFLEAICDDDGALPAVGDSDSGNVLTLGTVCGNHAAQLFEFCAAAGLGGPAARRRLDPLGAAWFAGSQAAASASPPQVPARDDQLRALAFRDAGYYVIRGAGMVLVLRAGPSGLRGRGSHDHNDQLSFVVSFDGHPILVDGGTCTYTADRDQHAWDLATAHHNTVALDGLEQSPISLGSVTCTVRNAPGRGAFVDADRAGRIAWQGTVCYCAATTEPIEHARTVAATVIAPGVIEVEVRDLVRDGCNPVRSASANLLFHPECKVVLDGPTHATALTPAGRPLARISVERGGPALLKTDTAALVYANQSKTQRLVVPLSVQRDARVCLTLKSPCDAGQAQSATPVTSGAEG